MIENRPSCEDQCDLMGDCDAVYPGGTPPCGGTPPPWALALARMAWRMLSSIPDCYCHEAYRDRNMTDPGCIHCYLEPEGSDLATAYRAIPEHIRKEIEENK